MCLVWDRCLGCHLLLNICLFILYTFNLLSCMTWMSYHILIILYETSRYVSIEVNDLDSGSSNFKILKMVLIKVWMTLSGLDSNSLKFNSLIVPINNVEILAWKLVNFDKKKISHYIQESSSWQKYADNNFCHLLKYFFLTLYFFTPL